MCTGGAGCGAGVGGVGGLGEVVGNAVCPEVATATGVEAGRCVTVGVGAIRVATRPCCAVGDALMVG